MCVNNAHHGFKSLICCSKEGPGYNLGLHCNMLTKQCTGELKHTCSPPFWIEFGAKPLSSILRCMYGFLASSFRGAPACCMLFPKTCRQFSAQIELGTLTTAPPRLKRTQPCCKSTAVLFEMQRTASEILTVGNPVMYIKEQNAGIWEALQMCRITACCDVTYPFCSLLILKFDKD